MDQRRLHISSRVVEAEWLAPRLAPFGSGIAAIVPGGFPAYIRILHPARGPNDQPIRWADVALKSGRTMHRLAQFHAISNAPPRGSMGAVDPPEPGKLPSDLLRVLCAALAEHTSTPESCFFCLWEGYGWLNDNSSSTVEFRPIGEVPAPPASLGAAVPDGPRVDLPSRNYLLFEGPLEAATELGRHLPGGVFFPQSPNLFWPHDRAWCVASEIDLFCTLVGGSNALVDSLIANPHLEAWRVFPDDPVTADSDAINR